MKEKRLTNNIGCMSKKEIESFADMVLKECGYPYTMKWTTAGDIMIEPFIYIDESHINEYPYMVKERVLHEVAHIDTHPQDDRHGEIFHARLAELINQFMAKGVLSEFVTRTQRETAQEIKKELEQYADDVEVQIKLSDLQSFFEKYTGKGG